MFEFVLFNIIQNSVKYNVPNGVIVVKVDLQDNLNDIQERILMVEVIDTGIGIDIDR